MGSDPGSRRGVYPVAIVGMSCRFPGANGPQEYWSLLKSGTDAIGTIPADRWDVDFYYSPDPARPSRVYTKAGGFLPRPYRFDAEFFGVSPREAAQIDPQQRLALELVWEALESAGIVPSSLAGSETGVVMGVSNTDYAGAQREHGEGGDPYIMSGSANALVSNRISYILDLHGPSFSVDTACSSALVAVHQACEALRREEASLAIAGGVNMLLSPFPSVGFSRAHMLSPTGHCHSFDAGADGYVRSEGGGVVILKPLAAALADGDPVYAVIVGSGVNSDGRTAGISMPNMAAQETLLRRVYARAAVDPATVDYVEAHGTGTGAGDPVECGAIGAVLGAVRPEGQPCLIGSGKTNIGHLESAAGMAGLLKVVLALRHREIPATINVETLNPRIKFDALNLAVVTEPTPLAPAAAPLVMGVNSFGFGGTNAHLIVEEYRADTPAPAPGQTQAFGEDGTALLAISARSAAALTELAARYERMLRRDGADFAAICRAAGRARAHLPHRLAVTGASATALADGLAAFVAGDAAPNVLSGEAFGTPARLAFVFSGNGSQWLGMGRELLAHETLIAQWVEKVDAVLRPLVGWSLLDYLARDGAPADAYDKTEIAQPTLFALQVAMVEWLRARGVDAGACVGHSVGEVAAAYAAGALTLEQACRVIAHRSAVQGKTAGLGKMMAVGLSAAKAAELIEPYGRGVTLAAFNSPGQVTLAGDEEVLNLIGQQLEEEGTFHRLLPLDYAFHSRVMDDVKGELLERLSGLAPRDGAVPFVSTVTGGTLPGSELGAQYWWENIREPVRFAEAIDGLARSGVQAFLEIGPHAVLTFYIRDCLREAGIAGAALSTLRRQEPEADALRAVVAQSYVAGVALDFARLYPGRGPWAALPTYPWQGEDHVFAKFARPWSPVSGTWQHVLLGYRLTTAAPTWEQVLEPSRFPYLRDHVVQGSMVFPAAGYVEVALAAGALKHGGEALTVEGLRIEKPLVIAESDPPRLELALLGDDNSFRVSAGPWNETRPASVAVGRVVPILAKATGGGDAIDAIRARLAGRIDGDEHYRLCAEHGLAYGDAFRGVAEIRFAGAEALGRIVAPAAIAAEAASYHFHPALLDACIQTVFATFAWTDEAARNASFVPVGIDRLRLYRNAARVAWCHARLTERASRSAAADFQLYDDDGLVAEIDGLRLRRIDAASVPAVPTYHWQHQLASRTLHLAPAAPLAALAKAASDAAGGPSADTVEAELERIAAAYAARAIDEIAGAADAIVLDDLVAQGAVARRNLLYLRAMLGMLERRGTLTRDDRGWRRTARAEDPDALWRAALTAHPDRLASLELIARNGDRMAAFLAGTEDDEFSPLLRDADLVEQLVESDPLFARRNRTAAGIVSRLLRTLPPSDPLRVLEIGDGPAGLAASLLPLLPADRVTYDYAVTDEDGAARAAADLGDRPNFRVRVLPLDRAPDAADVETVDFVLIGNAMFGVGELKSALAAIARLVKPGGIVASVSGPSDALATFLFGMSSHWWDFTDIDLRTDGPLVGAETLAGMLGDAGFAEIETIDDGRAVLARKRPAPRFTEINDREPGFWLVVAPQGSDNAAALNDRLDMQGHRVASLAGGDRASCRAALRDLAAEAGDARLHVVFFAATDGAPQTGIEGGFAVLSLLQAAEELGLLPRLDLWLVTQGAMAAPGRVAPVDPAQATIWGVGRTMMVERSDLTCRLVDLDPMFDQEAAAAGLIDEFVLAETETDDEIVLSGGGRYVPRVRRGPPAMPVTPEHGYGLANVRRDGHEETMLRALPRRALAPDEVRVRTRAAGVNFRDVLQRGGILPEEAFEGGFAGATMGMEFAGEILEIGAAVTRVKPGDAVFGFAPAALGSRIVTAETSVFAKPAGWSDAEAATLPVAMVTALFSLEHLARLRRGERVLIHGGAGGVGLAAIQVAQAAGAEIFATAGTPEKRAFLRRLGVPHVFDSRTLEFDREIRRVTGGEGVDVVLNSIAGEAIAKGMALLRPYGRFLELGKRDFFANSRLGLEPFRRNIQFFGVDVNTLIAERPDLTGAMVDRLMALIAAGTLKPLVHRVFPVSRAAEAFRYMQQSRQIGKVIVGFDDGAPSVEPLPAARLRLTGDATYLVTGGRGGFGLATAEWLVSRGARNLVLVGRRAETEKGAAAVLAGLRAQGVAIHEAACDVADADALGAVFAAIDRDMKPLKGVFHAAGVIEDSLLAKLTREKYDAVTRPKVLGAFNLDRLTRDRALDHFVLYSSATTLIGNPGQSSYVAANLYLEALAASRRAQGLPALAMLWGAIGRVGHLAKNPELAKLMEDRLGVAPIDPARAFDGLEQAMVSGVGEIAVAELDWSRLSRLPRIAASPKYAGLVVGQGGDGADSTLSLTELTLRIARSSLDEATALIVPVISRQISEVMRIPLAKLDADGSLIDVGMDSMMMVELQMMMERAFGLRLPVLDLMDRATIRGISRRLAEEIQRKPQADGSADRKSNFDIDIDAVPEEKLDQVLGELLKEELDIGP